MAHLVLGGHTCSEVPVLLVPVLGGFLSLLTPMKGFKILPTHLEVSGI